MPLPTNDRAAFLQAVAATLSEAPGEPGPGRTYRVARDVQRHFTSSFEQPRALPRHRVGGAKAEVQPMARDRAPNAFTVVTRPELVLRG